MDLDHSGTLHSVEGEEIAVDRSSDRDDASELRTLIHVTKYCSGSFELVNFCDMFSLPDRLSSQNYGFSASDICSHGFPLFPDEMAN